MTAGRRRRGCGRRAGAGRSSTIHPISGNTAGLKPSQKRALERLLQRRVGAAQLVSPELATELAAISRDIGRQVGVLLDRRGRVEAGFVGTAVRIFLPEIGRARAGSGHFRGVRHVHTVLGERGLERDDLADLTKLRLDAVVTVSARADGGAGTVHYATLLPGTEADHQDGRARDAHALGLDFGAHIAALEQEQARVAQARATAAGVRAVVIGVYPDRATAAWRLAEMDELARTAGVALVGTVTQLRRAVDGKYVVGRGKLDEAVLRCLGQDAGLILVDHSLSPAQGRAIAAASELKVIDRTQLILDIFAQHATSRDGKLQVELAQLRYTLPRLTDLDAGLSRLTGGIGGRGPGETKLEINRRRARDRIARLEREIAGLSRQRALRRQRRQSGALPVVSIVGYTNAGKSTLLNRLTGSTVAAENKLFATLDPTSRRLRFPREHEAVVTDTVGFIRDLPPTLLRAFRATLEELEGADLLLHVVDLGDPERDAKVAAVEALLAELDLGSIPRLLVLNKADLADPLLARAVAERRGGIPVSAATGAGLLALVQAVAHRLWQHEVLPADDGWAAAARAALFGR